MMFTLRWNRPRIGGGQDSRLVRRFDRGNAVELRRDHCREGVRDGGHLLRWTRGAAWHPRLHDDGARDYPDYRRHSGNGGSAIVQQRHCHPAARTLASSLYVTLNKTRSEAITLNSNVTLQPKPGGWSSGWQMLDPNNNVLDDYTPAPGITIAGPAAVTYRSSGRLPAGVAPIFQITTTAGSTVNYQCVSVDLGGRPYMAAAQIC